MKKDIIDMIAGMLWSTILAIHLLCMAYWVGGGLVVWRSDIITDRSLQGVHSLSLRFQLYTRYYRTLWHLMPLAAISGVALLCNMGPILSPIYHLMMFCWVLMTGLFLWAYFSPLRELKRALRMQPKSLTRIRHITLLMTFIGIIAAFSGAFRELI